MSDDNKKDLDELRKSFASSYNETSIGGDEGLRGIRLSPSQYLGSKGVAGAIQGAIEIIQNGVDEASALINYMVDNGYSIEDIEDFVIEISIFKDDSITIEDDGRGIPVAISPKFNIPAIRAAFEKVNVGGKGQGYVTEESTSAYVVGTTIGKHGSGAACANATSDFFYVDSYLMSEGNHYRVEYEEAYLTKEVHLIGPSPEGKHGTKIHFRPSQDVFDLYHGKLGEVQRFFNHQEFADILREYAYNTNKINFVLNWEEEDGTISTTSLKSEDFVAQNRIRPYCKDGKVYSTIVADAEKEYALTVHIGIDGNRTKYLACNMVPVRGGTHLEAVNEALNKLTVNIVDQLNEKIAKNFPSMKPYTMSQYQSLRVNSPANMVGMYLSINMKDPDYTSQAKEFLVAPKIMQSLVAKFTEALHNELLPLTEAIIAQSMNLAFMAIESKDLMEREKERKKKEKERRERYERRTGKNSKEIPGTTSEEMKIVHAGNLDYSKVVLYITEGDTASTSLIQARDSASETIIPIEARPPNVLNHTEDALEEKKKFNLLFRYFAKRYKAIILALDPDADGDYMRMLLIMFLYKYPEFREHYLLGGRVYNLKLPKFMAIKGTGEESIVEPLHNYAERQEHMRKHAGEHGWNYESNKGVGSISPKILRGLLDNPDSFDLIHPDSIEEGILVVKRFLSDTKYKRNYITANYGSISFQNYTQNRYYILKRHEMLYDIDNLSDQFSSEFDLTGVHRDTFLELVMAAGSEEDAQKAVEPYSEANDGELSDFAERDWGIDDEEEDEEGDEE